MAKQWTKWIEHSEKEKDKLIEILKKANAEKDEVINKQAGDLVFAHKKIMNREFIIKKIKELVSNETQSKYM